MHFQRISQQALLLNSKESDKIGISETDLLKVKEETMAVGIRKEDIKPVCPHCSQMVEEIIEVKRNWGALAINRIFCCPHCHKILGMSAGAG